MNRTYEEILRGMLDRAPEDIDKREGSVIYDALAPTAYFLAQQDFQLEHFPDLVFLDTAVGDKNIWSCPYRNPLGHQRINICYKRGINSR